MRLVQIRVKEDNGRFSLEGYFEDKKPLLFLTKYITGQTTDRFWCPIRKDGSPYLRRSRSRYTVQEPITSYPESYETLEAAKHVAERIRLGSKPVKYHYIEHLDKTKS